MGRSREDAPRDVPDRRDGLRSAGDVRLLLEPRRARDLRAAVRVRLPRAAAQGRSEHGGGDARDLGGRPSVEDPHPAGHPFRGRSGVQGQEARAHRGRLRLFVQAPARPEDARAVPLVSSTARSSAPTTCSPRRKRPGGSTTTRRSRACKSLDRYTLQITLKEPDYVLLGYLTQSAMAAVAREVIEAYGDASGWAMANPVGTGPFRLKEWRRGQKIVLEANPNFRAEYFPRERRARRPRPRRDDEGQAAAAARPVDISIIEESNPQLLAFASGELDYVNVPRGPRRERARPRQRAQAANSRTRA